MKAKTNQKIYSATDREELTRTDISNRVCSNTRSKYRSGVKKFLEYCESRNLDAIPTELNLCHFISETAREINPNSAGSYLSGIVHHFAETFPEVREIRLSMKVKNTLKGCKKTFSKPVKRAEALTLSDIEAAAKFFDSTFDDLLFNTILALGFNGLHRLGELVEPDSVALRDDRKLIKRWSFDVAEDETYAQYTLPFSKTDTFFNGCEVVIPARKDSPYCPLKMVMKYIVIRDSAFITNPFLLLRSNGYIPTRSWFMKRLKLVFGDTRSGHSMRAGGATAYAKSGVRLETIQRMGRWKSSAFKTYIQGNPLLNLLAAQSQAPFPGHSQHRGSPTQATYTVSLILE